MSSSEKPPRGPLVFLTGPMGSGKSTIGRALALRLNLPFMDLDALIEAQAGQPISSLFANGESGFRALEREMLLRTAVEHTHTAAVVATGGGIVISPENRATMRAAGHIFYLRASIETLTNRLSSSRQRTTRPLLAESGELAPRIIELLHERRAAYEDCDHVIDGDRDIINIVDELVSHVNAHQGAKS